MDIASGIFTCLGFDVTDIAKFCVDSLLVGLTSLDKDDSNIHF